MRVRVPKTRVNPNATPSILAQNLKMHSVSDYNTRRGKDDGNKDITADQWVGYNSFMWYTRLPVRHSLPNPISTKLVDTQSCLCHGQHVNMLGNTMHWKFTVTLLLFSVHLPRPPLTDWDGRGPEQVLSMCLTYSTPVLYWVHIEGCCCSKINVSHIRLKCLSDMISIAIMCASYGHCYVCRVVAAWIAHQGWL